MPLDILDPPVKLVQRVLLDWLEAKGKPVQRVLLVPTVLHSLPLQKLQEVQSSIHQTQLHCQHIHKQYFQLNHIIPHIQVYTFKQL